MSSTKNGRFSLDNVAEDAEEEIPRMPLITSREPEQQLTGARMSEQGREATAPAVSEPTPVVRGSSNKARQLAEQRFKPTGEKRPTSVKLDVWLDDALNAKVYELRMAGFRKMTRESVISDALAQYLGVKAPKD
jgi:hypothetical protein